MKNSTKPPIINCHTHVFKGEHVPPFLAKCFVIWPFYYLLHLPSILKLFKFYLKVKSIWFRFPYKNIQRKYLIVKAFIYQNLFLKIFSILFQSILIISALLIISDWVGLNEDFSFLEKFKQWSDSIGLNINNTFFPIKVLIVGLAFFVIKSGRNLILFLLKNTVKIFSFLPGKMTKDLIKRYVLLGRYTIYKHQGSIFSKLENQYLDNTKFIVLPMDMTYMKAGKTKKNYYEQLEGLAKIKKGVNRDAILPFVFIDPRRFEDDPYFFRYYQNEEGEILLNDCVVKEYIENQKFCGFKIYPALGYYPFDKKLLPLWKYAADHQIPIMTHCIKGTIFYRGKKRKAWGYHPIFKESTSKSGNDYVKLSLPQTKNIDFTVNFTHPLNYLVLLKEELLRVLVSKSNHDIKKLFGYTDENTKLKRDLSHLKICLAHFGGEDQWDKHLESDRYSYAQQVIQKPEVGIDFLRNSDGKFSWNKLEDCWKYVDWYSIICSMMIQHENIYADISYILHNEDIFPLLKQTINHEKIGEKVLFGTDFFVVRNHKSEKDLAVNTIKNLTEEEFDLIARYNPQKYISKAI